MHTENTERMKLKKDFIGQHKRKTGLSKRKFSDYLQYSFYFLTKGNTEKHLQRLWKLIIW